jgi:hypothetical protein
MSMTGEGQGGTSCATANFGAAAAAIPPRKIRLSISVNLVNGFCQANLLFCRASAELPDDVRNCSNILLQDVVHIANRIGDKRVGLGLARDAKKAASIGRCA